jgi:putative endonuclease
VQTVFEFLKRVADAIRRRLPVGDVAWPAKDIARRYLRRQGCLVLERNYHERSGAGEIDLVACQGGVLVFVEVKTADTGAVDAQKRNALERAAREYARRSGVEWIKTRFDVVSVATKHPVRVDWQRGVFR